MKVLLLAGTSEAKKIAWGLVGQGVNAVASLAGATRDPEPLPLPTRVGGFGGADGFAAFLAEAGITAVIDATHPFAARITNRTAAICAARSVPYVQVLRPPWQAGKGDTWTEIATPQDAASIIPPTATVFLATGRQTLNQFAGLEGRRVICRQIDPPTAPFPFEGGEFVISRPPFSVTREEELFLALGVDWLVVKNAGGKASATKLTAARNLGIPVAMIARPAMPDAARVETPAQALAWVAAL
ncbi:cobalt-precorrin-6A reductase [Octadecabacter sp. R77987]|uniref:cobalt-precorrin-6A reductase n=1 Tax=Octadecabacter sp. R77987 TaxID=3093874 RepID=UPI00366F5E31